jgi:hypothetical protein
MAISSAPWNGDPSRWPDAESYCRSALIDENPAGKPKSKDACHLPVRDPGGAVNKNALGAAAAALAGARGGVSASSASKAAAARKLRGLYRQAGMTPPDSLSRMG